MVRPSAQGHPLGAAPTALSYRRPLDIALLSATALTADVERGARFGAVLGIVGFIDIPIIHFSVSWWRTLHPEPVVLRASPQLPGEMIVTLLVAVLAATMLYTTLVLYRTRLERLSDDN